jgi:plastocyanin
MLHVIEIRNFAFSPSSLKIGIGDSVRWHNSDGARHSAKCDGPPVFDTGLISPGNDSSEVAFSEPAGTEIEYYCEPHPHMVGRITIGG